MIFHVQKEIHEKDFFFSFQLYKHNGSLRHTRMQVLHNLQNQKNQEQNEQNEKNEQNEQKKDKL